MPKRAGRVRNEGSFTLMHDAGADHRRGPRRAHPHPDARQHVQALRFSHSYAHIGRFF